MSEPLPGSSVPPEPEKPHTDAELAALAEVMPSVPVTLDELVTGSTLMITREVVLPVEFVLAARTLMPLGEIRTVAAHPQASAQCRSWLLANVPDAVIVDWCAPPSGASVIPDGVPATTNREPEYVP